jgi:hypothetical protein
LITAVALVAVSLFAGSLLLDGWREDDYQSSPDTEGDDEDINEQVSSAEFRADLLQSGPFPSTSSDGLIPNPSPGSFIGTDAESSSAADRGNLGDEELNLDTGMGSEDSEVRGADLEAWLQEIGASDDTLVLEIGLESDSPVRITDFFGENEVQADDPSGGEGYQSVIFVDSDGSPVPRSELLDSRLTVTHSGAEDDVMIRYRGNLIAVLESTDFLRFVDNSGIVLNFLVR